MKQTPLTKLLAIGAVSVVALGTAFAQTTTKETTTATTGAPGVTSSTTTGATSSLDASGTITTYSPGTDYISVRTTSSEAPVKYYTTKSTTVVDSAGAPVDLALLRADLPVRYTYVKQGDRMVVSKITVQKPVEEIKKTTTTTTTTTP